MKYPDYPYKVRGSLIIWTLHRHATDAFLVWILAQDFSRARNGGKPSGRFHEKHFINQLAKDMGCNIITAESRLERAIEFGFINEEINDQYLITGRNKMVEIAMKECLSDDSHDKFYRKIFSNDIEYTVKAHNLIDPKNTQNTKINLYKIFAVHGSQYLWSRNTHAKILGNNRDAIIKLSNRADLDEVGTCLLINPMSLLRNPDCSRLEAINAFKNAESLYRQGDKIRGRELLHFRRVDLQDFRPETYLCIQLPNTYWSRSVEKEVPVKFDTYPVLLGPGNEESYVFTSKRKEQRLESRIRFVTSRERLGQISLPDRLIGAHLDGLHKVLDEPRCHEAILQGTGAEDVVHPTASTVTVWRTKAVKEENTPIKCTGKTGSNKTQPSLS